MADITLSTSAFNNLEGVGPNVRGVVWRCDLIEPLLPIVLRCNRANAIEQEKRVALTPALFELTNRLICIDTERR
jgi:hypothetical protein